MIPSSNDAIGFASLMQPHLVHSSNNAIGFASLMQPHLVHTTVISQSDLLHKVTL